MENKYYVYLHIKETTGEPFYIGKGKGNRAYQSGKNKRSLYWHNIVNKYGYDIIFLELNLTDEEAIRKEIYWINRIGRKDLNEGPLVNFTDGGEGVSRRIHSKETRKKISESNKGKIISDEHKEILRNKMTNNKYFFNKKHSDETKKILSELSKGNKNSLGVIRSIEYRTKMSESKSGKKLSEETKDKLKVICPHCNKQGSICIMKRWHFDNCKNKNEQ